MKARTGRAESALPNRIHFSGLPGDIQVSNRARRDKWAEKPQKRAANR